jgi:hypothetical protein
MWLLEVTLLLLRLWKARELYLQKSKQRRQVVYM